MILPNLHDSEYIFGRRMSELSSMRVGGLSDVYFEPRSLRDLKAFLCGYKGKIDNVFIAGNMSNVVISDDGLECTLSLNSLCNQVKFENDTVAVGSGVLVNTLINECIARSISCCEDLYTIPGRLGGMLYMNAGIPSFEIKDVLIGIECINKYNGEILYLDAGDLCMKYRNGNIPKHLIVLSAVLKTKELDAIVMQNKIKEYRMNRLKTQPIAAKTCGSTFKNPNGQSAWKIIREAGAHKISVGEASMSQMHSNFLINNGNATASDVIKLIELVRERVFNVTGIELELELRIIKRDNV